MVQGLELLWARIYELMQKEGGVRQTFIVSPVIHILSCKVKVRIMAG